MSVAEMMRRTRQIKERLDQEQAGTNAEERRRFDWFGSTCPCGLPLGECREHPRARPNQRPPSRDWRTWLYMAGRGAGKTRSGAEWVREQIEHHGARRVALIAPTAADVRDVMIEGESGLMAICPPWARPKYEPSKRRLTWPNGAIAHTYSADEPERLRGPQHDLGWLDELGAWRYPKTYDMFLFGLRLGKNPRAMVTTTPRMTTLVKEIVGAKTTAITTGTTYENKANLAPEFIEQTIAKYEGTRLGRQEIYGELLEIAEGVWFPHFDPAKHVSEAAAYDPALPVRVAIDCGVSRHTGAVFFQVRDDKGRRIVTVFGDYHAEDLYSAANAEAIKAKVVELTATPQMPAGRIDLVRLDPASSARTGVGPSAFGEYVEVFGKRLVGFWPQHLVADGLDQIDVLLGGEAREPEILIHPDCTHLKSAFQSYKRAERAGEYLNHPEDPQHPAEDLMDSLRGGVRDAMPAGRVRPPKPAGRVRASRFIG